MQSELPDIGDFDYIIEALTELGPAKQSASGPEGVTWGDLEAYTGRTGVDFDGWESVQLVRLSGVYAGAVRRYDGEDESPPMQSENRQEARLKEMQAYLRGVKVEDGRRSESTASRR